jgi:hypothetical protein
VTQGLYNCKKNILEEAILYLRLAKAGLNLQHRKKKRLKRKGRYCDS